MFKVVGKRKVGCDSHCIDGHKGPAGVLCCTCGQFLCKVSYKYHITAITNCAHTLRLT